ncbi:MAG TPA: hypothetical protein VMJ32_10230 [Pirellulales bacterium]|nr:hypothetical protein [Pirellulales bacterium]
MRRLLALSVIVFAANMGCRMCASPYDYCGPVVESGCVEPNGRGGCYGGGGGCGCGCGGGSPMEGVPTNAAPMNAAPMNGMPMNGQYYENSPGMNSPATMPSNGAMPKNAPQGMPTPANNPTGYNPAAWRQSTTMSYR